MTRKKGILSKIWGRKSEREMADSHIHRKLENNLDLITDE